MKKENAGWKRRFMKETDPDTGTKIAIQLNDCHVSLLDEIRFMDDLEGIEYCIINRSGPRSNSIITFKTLNEFKSAQSYSVDHSWTGIAPEYFVTINEGYAPLGAVFIASPENIQKFALAGMPLTQKPSKNYTGITPENLKLVKA
jgi:hypothetical protein